jgi:hypothetical protein
MDKSMSLIYEQKPSDSPYVETVIHGYTTAEGSSIRPAEIHWHMVFVKHDGSTRLILAGPQRTSGVASWGEGGEILWLKFKLGTFIPHLPTRKLLDSETSLPGALSKSFWLKGAAWEFPDPENIDTFIGKLAREEVIAFDPLIAAALKRPPLDIPPRTLRHRFLQATGLPQGHIVQVERAQRAAALLQQGTSILDTVHEAGYFDQPHLTRSLKQFVGYTPGELVRQGAT